MTALFFSRLAMYLLAFSLPLLHPAIVVTYDVAGWWLWFGLIPVEMLIAYFLSPPRLKVINWLILAVLPIIVSIAAVSGFSTAALRYLAGGIVAFVSTVLVFKTGGRGKSIAAFELFALAVLYYKMLSFSRASDAVARESSGITILLLVLSIGAFLFHGLVLYLASLRERIGRKNRREFLLFLALAVPVGLVIAFLFPHDFVNHSIVFNRLKDPVRPRLTPIDGYTDGLPGGNVRSDMNGEQENGSRDDNGERGDGDGDSRGGTNRLEGFPGERWDEQGNDGRGEGKQYAVMVVASSLDPVYAAEGYFGEFHSERGFAFSREEEFNDLVYMRLLETWRSDSEQRDKQRADSDIFFLSTIPKRVLAYEPRSVEPTVLSRKYHPFDYSYSSISAVSKSGEQEWRSARELTEAEREELRGFLAIPLSDQSRERFGSYLEGIIDEDMRIYARIEAILKSFRRYQYEIGFDDDVSVQKMENFLFSSKEGDCTEFSNTAAILGRLAGVPSRVVTGYLATSALQTNAHRRGLLVLMEKIERLKEYTLDELFLVTTSHRHSWVQFYLPDLGWIDFESTMHAIPPLGSGDPNSMDVVIPIIQERDEQLPAFQFPWFFVLKVVLILAGASILGLYLLRYGRQMHLKLLSRVENKRGLLALQKLLLMNLAVEGYDLKEPSKTLVEYSEQYPELESFAALYTQLRYRERFEFGERSAQWRKLRDSSAEFLANHRRRGFMNAVKRIFSLRGLSY